MCVSRVLSIKTIRLVLDGENDETGESVAVQIELRLELRKFVQRTSGELLEGI